MWEPGSSSSSSTSSSGNRNRGVFLLLTVLVICFALYKAWGPLLLITCALVLVVHTCYSLLVNDSLLPPHTLVLLRYVRALTLELAQTVKLLLALGLQRFREVLQYLKQKHEERCRQQQREAVEPTEDSMNGRHKNVYRLSTTDTESTGQISPIGKDSYHAFAMNGAYNIASTSTPISRGPIWKKEAQQNGDLGLFTPISSSPTKKLQSLQSENKRPVLTLPHSEETLYSPKGSPWGTSISPKIREKAGGVKTVQTVAGPLLASTRYNIDPKVYTDVSSPGLTSRLTKYATEANNRLIHQPQYGAGQFPKVNLNASPAPLLSPKVVRSRMPVTVRVAPPEMTSYSTLDIHSTQERQKSTSPLETKDTKPCSNVVQVLKDISLKRHASREDIMLDLVKKQRTDRISEDQLENLEEMMQKRARDESVTSEEDLSPQSKTERPTKRPKASSCHDILNSLSSSISVLSGVKRKAMDSSRCNTPDIEKHFKLSKSPIRSSSLTKLSSGEIVRSKEQLNVKVPIPNGEPPQYKAQEKTAEVIKKNEHSQEKQLSPSSNALNMPTPKIYKEHSASSKAEKLTDKLFMKAGPQTNEKLKSLIKEQESVEVKFTSDDKDEIKKQDIVNMRQNSMRLRLQSMFDAISGKSANKIDPDVVIQAEEVNPPTSSVYTSLSSLTTTTTVNTSPITTTIVPILKSDTETKSPTTKHVTFNLPNMTSSLSSTVSSTTSQPTKEADKPTETKSLGNVTSSAFGISTSTTTLTFNSGSNAVTTSTSNALPSVSKSLPASTSNFTFPASSGTTTTSTATSNGDKLKNSTATSINPTTSFAIQSAAESVKPTFSVSSSGFSFGNTTKTTSITTSIVPSTSTVSFSSMFTPAASKSSETSAANTTIPNFENTVPKSTTINTPVTQMSNTLSSFGNEKKESGFSFGATPSTNTSSSTANSQPAPIFGMSTASPMFSAGSNATSSASPMFSAGSNVTSSANNSLPSSSAPASITSAPATTSAASIFTFGAGNKPGSSFFFGRTTASSTTATATPPTNSFGGATQTLGSASTASAVTFATPAASNAMNTPAVTASNLTFGNTMPFGGSTNQPSLFSGTSTSAPNSMFKSPTTTATATTTTGSIFGSHSTISSFGATPTPPTTSTTPSLFGNNVPASTTTTSSIPSLFGNTAVNSAATTASSTISAFGGTSTQGSIFSGMNATTTTASTSIFGSATSSAAPTGLFSSNNSANPITTNANNSGSIFGQAKSPSTMSFGTTNPTFGSNNPSSTFSAPSTSSATSAFQIGSNAPSSGGLPSFNSIKPTTQFGASANPSPQVNATGSIFGSSTATFGATNNSAPPAFGSPAASGGFGMPNNTNTAPPAFGTAAPSFGGAANATSSPFGAQTTTSTLFGSSAPGSATNTGASNGATFTFGGNQQAQQQPQQQAQQPTSTFSFSGASNNNAANTGGIFQFGASSAPKPTTGFNFNAPTSTPAINFTAGTGTSGFNAGAPGVSSTFNAPAPNMFSIGSGSSTPRSRTTRKKRQR